MALFQFSGTGVITAVLWLTLSPGEPAAKPQGPVPHPRGTVWRPGNRNEGGMRIHNGIWTDQQRGKLRQTKVPRIQLPVQVTRRPGQQQNPRLHSEWKKRTNHDQ